MAAARRDWEGSLHWFWRRRRKVSLLPEGALARLPRLSIGSKPNSRQVAVAARQRELRKQERIDRQSRREQ